MDFKQISNKILMGDSNCNEQNEQNGDSFVSRADSKECRNDGLASHIDGQVKDTCRLASVAKPLNIHGPSWPNLPGR